jgi:TonB family protein
VQAPQPVQEIKPVQENRPVETAQPVQDTVPVQTAQPIQQVTQQQVTTVTQPIQEETKPSPEVAQTVTRTEAPVETTETVEQQAVTAQPVVTAALTPTVSTVTERSVVEDSHHPVETPQMVEQTVSARAAPEVQQRAAVQHMAVRSRPTTRPDYGWLSQALWSSVEQRKRYPQEARRNHWEGRVILRLKIEQRGAAIHLLDVTLEESSGHTVLDRHTLEMVRKAFPLDVNHALTEQKVELHLPFSYRME